MKLTISVSPHIRRDISVKRIMYTVSLALIPALGGAIYFFGLRALYLTLISCASAILAEAFAQRIMKRKITIFDGSALLTGILLAFNLPVGSPFWIPVVGSAFAILVAKQAFGGLGYNFINPALAGRAFLMASWPTIMTAKWSAPVLPLGATQSGISAITNATPLGVIDLYANNSIAISQLASNNTLTKLFFGSVGGCLGETSVLLLLIGGIFLIAIKYIDWRIPFSYIGTVGILMQILYKFGITPADGIFHILAGGLFLGAIFMATDYVTSPITHKGRWIFGAGCGIITIVIRIWGGYPEGVCYAILLMNCLTPLIDKVVKPKKLGEKK
ncbi:RnfABCDGE type electron transport complex subunit D [candidate division WOR-3 bacterium]|nr:RnfABCDGE type electron transport complex subunit D [candidate division WOR-3 bacterium]